MKKFISLLIVLFCAGMAFGQSANVITEMLESSEASFGQICYLSAVYQNLVDEDATYDEAIDALYQQKQIPEKYFDTTPIAMANLAFIYAQMWNIKGGIMYRATKGSPRYAFKQLKSDGIIPDYTDPTGIVSGWEALNIYTSCDFLYGKASVSAADEDE